MLKTASTSISRLASPGRRRRAFRGAAAGLLLLGLAACDSAEERKLSHYERALELESAGEPEKAVLELQNALRIDDGYAPALFALARVHEAAGRWGAAAGALRSALDLEPDNLEGRVTLARALVELQDMEAAGRAADEALALAPGNAGALAVRAAADLVAEEPELAVERARAALAADPGQELARMVLVAERVRAGDPEGALARLDATPPSEGGNALGMDLVRVQLLAQLGDGEAVGAALERLAAENPDDEALNIALVRWRMSGETPDRAGAEAALRDFAARRPGDAEAALRVVGFLRGTQSVDAARAELERLRETTEDPARQALFERSLAGLEAETGDRAAAIARTERAVAATEDAEIADQARILLARLLDPAQEGARRLALVAEVLERDPGNVEALALRGEANLRADRVEEAVQDYRAALNGAPDSVELLERLAVAHERAGAPALAAERRAAAARASGFAPAPSMRLAGQLRREGKLESAESVILDALSRNPRDLDLLRSLADIRLARSDWAGAEEVAAALEGAPDGEALRTRLEAVSLLGQGRSDETLALLEGAWAARGDAVDMEGLVRAYVVAGEIDRAREVLRDALKENPNDVRAAILLSDVERAAGSAAEAETILQEAIERTPEDPALRFALVRLYEAQGDAGKAEAAIRAGLDVAPDNPALRFALAARSELAGDSEAAIAAYEALYVERPDDPLVANNLASALSEGRSDAESLDRALTIAQRFRGSTNPVFLNTYGWALHRAGDHDQAVVALRSSAEQLPDNAIAQYHLGMAYVAIDQAERAREALTRALELADAGSSLPQRASAEATLETLEDTAIQ